MNAVLENILSRRSCRAYRAKQLSEEQLADILQAGAWAPSGMNRQPWQFTVIQEPENLERLNRTVQGAGGAAGRASFFYGAPTLVAVSAPEAISTANADCALALGNMMLEAHAIGVASCWINGVTGAWESPEVQTLMRELGVPADHRVWGCAALGFAAGPFKEVPRKNIVVLRR